jgi:hypothetical protein
MLSRTRSRNLSWAAAATVLLFLAVGALRCGDGGLSENPINPPWNPPPDTRLHVQGTVFDSATRASIPDVVVLLKGLCSGLPCPGFHVYDSTNTGGTGQYQLEAVTGCDPQSDAPQGNGLWAGVHSSDYDSSVVPVPCSTEIQTIDIGLRRKD